MSLARLLAFIGLSAALMLSASLGLMALVMTVLFTSWMWFAIAVANWIGVFGEIWGMRRLYMGVGQTHTRVAPMSEEQRIRVEAEREAEEFFAEIQRDNTTKEWSE